MKITPFQAFTILAQKYKNDDTNREKYDDIMHLYLAGIQNSEDKELYEKLIKDSALSDYQIDDSENAITNDAIRRYFESRLSMDTFTTNIDQLDATLLERNFDKIFSCLPNKLKIIIPLTIYKNLFMGLVKKQSGTAIEYGDAIERTKQPTSFSFLNDSEDKMLDRKNKLMILAKSAHAAMSVISTSPNDKYEINVYNSQNSPFSSKNRGRSDKVNQKVKSNTFGIMRSFMPLPADSYLFNEKGSNYTRCPDQRDFIPGAQQTQITFDNKFMPFVNSISGTVLCLLRVMAHQLHENEMVYVDNREQFKQYFKNIIAYLLYEAGGHSLGEFMRVFKLPEVIAEFKDIPGFEDLSLDKLFRTENEFAFERALEDTIKYQQLLLQKKQLHEELDSHPGLKKADLTRLTSLDNRNQKIDKAYDLLINTSATKDEREQALETLVKLLKIPQSSPTEQLKKIKHIMEERHQNTYDALFNNNDESTATRLDKAWKIYTDAKKTIQDRLTAQKFLIYVLDIPVPNRNLNLIFSQYMAARELVKAKIPEFIPGKTAFEAEPVAASHPKGQSNIKQNDRKPTHEYINLNIHNKLLMANGKPFTSRHLKLSRNDGFVFFTINSVGAILISTDPQPHRTNDQIIAAGKLRIENGRLTHIMASRNYHNANLFHIHNAIEYLNKHGIDTANTRVLTSTDPRKHLAIQAKRSTEFRTLYSFNANDLRSELKSSLMIEVSKIQKDLSSYANTSLISRFRIGLQKALGLESTKNHKVQFTKKALTEVNHLLLRIKYSKTPEHLAQIIKELEMVHTKMTKNYNKINHYGIGIFSQNLKKLKHSIDVLKDKHGKISSTDNSENFIPHDKNKMRQIKGK